MDSEYDRKFEEMKKYIPFLENMIKRLESTSTASENPRQAQLDKIRSLRDLLLDKKKRMKMDNLLKCEQVLVNLYAKVEQRDTPAGSKSGSTAQSTKPKEGNDLETVRNKLKSVVSKSIDDSQETLPEIARANIVAETCTPGSKEPALFQRRPNKLSPVRNISKSPIKPANPPPAKRNYTRVLLSPEPSSRRWDNNEKSTDKPLFSRRSPRRSPKRHSPTYNKKDRKKSKQGKKGKDLNITLNVPEESLESLNSKDILSRIMNCNDNDVDIETLREAKRQILNELKHTGAKCDDISDLLLKSYKKGSSSKKKDDVEEGELSDSESEAISSIYDNFILDDGNVSSKAKLSKTPDKPRKIQICLVINSDKDDVSTETKTDTSTVVQQTATDDFEMYDKKTPNIKENLQDEGKGVESTDKENESVNETEKKVAEVSISESSAEKQDAKCHDTVDTSKSDKADNVASEINKPANFYKPLNDDKPISNTPPCPNSLEVKDKTNDKNMNQPEKADPVLSSSTDNLPEIAAYLKSTEHEEKEDVEIPLLHDQSVATQKPKEDVVSEIDILQALKNEILGEPMTIPGSESTPLLHQPKLTKVASVQEIVPKKRISIEKYKKKSTSSAPTTNSLFINDPTLSLSDDSILSREENLKKQSLKLTEKECERFNFPTKLALDDDCDDLSDEDLERDFSLNDIYGNLAPKSPDSNDAPTTKNVPPVIIPVDPVKASLAPSKSDVDMRVLTPNITTTSASFETKQSIPKTNIEKTKIPLDPRMRKDLNKSNDKDYLAQPRPVPPVVNYPNTTALINPSMTPNRTPLLMTPSMTPNMTPNRVASMTPTRGPIMTPSMAPNMTPSRNPNMTPNARTFEVGNLPQFEADDNTVRKHVYAPMFPMYEQREGRERERSVAKEQERRSHWDQPEKERDSRRDSRWGDSTESRDGNRKLDPRSSSVHREIPDYSKSRYGESHNNYDNYKSRFNDRRDSYSRSDCPRTPLPSFGRSDAPLTPIHSFGRSDCPPTPSHPFGRSDCPLTPSHPFGRSDCPQTPSHPFGRPDFTRNDGSMTPSHSFGRGDMPTTPSHPFGRTEPQSRDPRLNRNSDYDNFQRDDPERNYYKDRNRTNYNNSYRPESNKTDSYRTYREHSVGRSEKTIYSEQDSRHYNRDRSVRRDSSVGRATSRDLDNDRIYPRDRSHGHPGNEPYHKYDSDNSRRGFINERSVGHSSRRFDNRASSVGRTMDDTDNRMSVKPDTGGSFTINTSVRSTFQDFLREDKIQVFDHSFDGRRKRASSVGRTLCRESSVGRSLPIRPEPMSNTIEHRSNFKRARSVGRDILTSERERSFKDIKEDFENFYKQNKNFGLLDRRSEPRDTRKNDRLSKLNEYKIQNSPTYKKDVPEKPNTELSSKHPYSPRKNYRDPRVRRGLQSTRIKYKDDSYREREKKNIGIVYSNDNITKGTILGSGYGVKNYKIPKIKRPVEEQKEPEEEKKEEAECKKKVEKDSESSTKQKTGSDNKSKNVKNKILKKEKLEEKADDNKKVVSSPKPNEEKLEKPERRITRLNKKSEISSPLSSDTTVNKVKKTRKAIISDSDSDVDQQESGKDYSSNIETTPKTEEKIGTSSPKKKQDISALNNEDKSNIKDTDNLESCFSVDDLDFFSDNLVSCPVIDNINALIADLDNDLEPSKITTEIGNEKSLSANSDKKSDETSEEFNDISEFIKNDLNKSAESPKKVDILKNTVNTNINETINQDSDEIKSLKTAECAEKVSAVPGVVDVLPENTLQQVTNDNIVSTTAINKENKCGTNENKKEENIEGIPDSTNEMVSKKSDLDDSLPDSTNGTPMDNNSFVTSSHDTLEPVNKDNSEPSSSNKETSINSIGSILSILQNKSKLKEILDLLGDQSSENEKIKKKLEKLSEIVSEEDDEVEDKQDQSTMLNVSGDSSSKSNEKNELVNEPLKLDDTNKTNEPPEEPSKSVDEENLKQIDDNVRSTDTENSAITDSVQENVMQSDQEIKAPKKQLVKKGKVKKRRGRPFKTIVPRGAKRITRSATPQVKKPSRELMKLQEDIKEMFISDDVLNATGIRMCRLAKLVDDNSLKSKEDSITESGPVVVLEKFKDMEAAEEAPPIAKPARKKPGPKPKLKPDMSMDAEVKSNIPKTVKYKPGPKSKTKTVPKMDDDDPYAFESDSVSENNDSIKSIDNGPSSDSENDSIDSSQSFGSSNDLLVESKKKPKRKRSGWKSGIIKPKNRKKKFESKHSEIAFNSEMPVPQRSHNIPDIDCFTDKSYCFQKNTFTYSCRLCIYSGEDIVKHYKQEHPHSEIPLSRLSLETAKEAIEQCAEINFQAISNVSSEKYVCRFCYKVFGIKKSWRTQYTLLEEFFWHVVSMHTGEYKHSCSLCVNDEICPFNLDIPPPPKDVKGQLIGYICEKCNFTQISLENLKTHVIVRHNDEQTEVYTINLAVMTRKAISALTRRSIRDPEKNRVLRSRGSIQSLAEASDDHSDMTDSDQSSEPLSVKSKRSKESTSPTIESKEKITNTNMQSKITFENDDILAGVSVSSNMFETIVKKEVEEEDEIHKKEIEALKNNLISEICSSDNVDTNVNKQSEPASETSNNVPEDINDCAHFKVSYTESGSKEYVCCINGIENHYKTTLLISFKKHVQLKHSEIWDGYCCLCKVIVTPQGQHKFKDCLQHYLDKHMDSFPILEKIVEQTENVEDTASPAVQTPSNKPYINVRPMSELISKEVEVPPVELELPTLPKIENVMSLGANAVEPSQPSPSYPPVITEPPKEDKKEYKYEEVQAEVMSKKHRVVLDTMMSAPKLINIFKCASRYCSFTSDSAELALVHASTHKRVGGENSLNCSYCDFDCSENAIDLVMHVFKAHGSCPYTCGYCFYRAAASQLVTAHISRIHRDVPLKVLSMANVPPPQTDAPMLSRNDAVLYYVCPHGCKFRAYTAGKYCEHLVSQHASELSHPCYICKDSLLTPQQLIQHMKGHELNVYQCTWCVYGADSETSLMFHASQKHPDRQPQAYLRVIQRVDKDGSTQLRVLPLVSFNKSKVVVQEVAPVASNENPVREAEREAERSIELEKLIGHTTQLIESVTPAPEIAANPPTETESAVTSIMEETEAAPETAEPSPAAVIDPVSVAPPPPPVTPPSVREKAEQVTPKIKTEPLDETPAKTLPTDVVCLDSDDENSRDSSSRLSVIALSDDESASADSPSKTPKEKKFKIIPSTQLLKCPNCLQLYRKVGGFKRHLNSCTPAFDRWACPHCGLDVLNREALLKHFVKDHSSDKCLNVCSACNARFPNLTLAKAHSKAVHGATKYVVSRVETADKEFECIVTALTSSAAPKRKRSSSGVPEPPAKLRRFGPQDVDLLPINPILDESVSCSLCEFNTKVRLNMVRHLQLHAEQQPVPQTAPINPVPHLETNEKHFDKMVNLASSSIVTRAPEKPSRPESSTTVSLLIPPEAASRYPKYVPDRQRHTCGAKGCSYISVDEAMLRCHWETLHSGTNDFHCVHCPPYQHLDTSKPLTAARIIAHLKMHDSTLYACSSCAYYHYKKQVLEKHLADVHKGSGRLMVVREEVSVLPAGPSQTAAPAPTMDLKPWQCGLCSFKSMLRPEVVEHCAKSHQSKMQFKCFYCPFRTSALENITKHQTNAHPKKNPEVFYYYYREGSIPEEPDGIPRWMKQRQKFGSNDPEVKSEATDPGDPPVTQTLTQMLSAPLKPVTPPVDLNIVKKEVEDTATEMTVEQLVKKYGQICEPNGLRYKCPLCKVVIEDTKEAMESHLYEELKYRKWICSVCSYKAFHKTGLNEHIISEHRGKNQELTPLPQDVNIEKWVAHILQHQTNAIEKNRENLSKQKIMTERPPVASTSTEKSKTPQEKTADKFSMKELEDAFGPLGVPKNMMFCCPKCNLLVKEEHVMRDHLESELTKIRWCCNNCAGHFQTYHEAQYHCRSAHAVGAARPVEAVRDAATRAAWLAAALRVQRLTMNCQPPPASALAPAPAPSPLAEPEDSLLVVRYEETVTPTEPLVNRKRPADDAPLEEAKRKPAGGACPHCPFKTRYNHVIKDHIYRHYDLKPFSCVFCDFTGYRSTVVDHLNKNHRCEYDPAHLKQTPLPAGPPTCLDLTPKPNKAKRIPDDDRDRSQTSTKVVCLICEQTLLETATRTHTHDKIKAEFGKKGDVVVKCCICLALRIDQNSFQEHHAASHPGSPVNYAFFKLLQDTREITCCGYCNKRFKYINDFKTHHGATHGSLPLKYSTVPFSSGTTVLDSDDEFETETPEKLKRVARKSTTKLPAQTVAKKSTTKLPYDVSDDDEDDEYSYYGTKPPPPEKYENVTTLMSFCNTMVPFTLKKLSEVIKIYPSVLVEDVGKKRPPRQ